MDVYLILGVFIFLATAIYVAVPFVYFVRTEVIYNESRYGIEEERMEFSDTQAIVRFEARLAENEFDYKTRSKVIIYHWLLSDEVNRREKAKEHIVWFLKKGLAYEGYWFAWMTQFHISGNWEEVTQEATTLLSDSLGKSGEDLQCMRHAGIFSKYLAPDFSKNCWNKLCEQFPDDPEIVSALATIHFGKRNYSEALKMKVFLADIPWSEDNYYKFRKTKIRYGILYPDLILRLPLVVCSFSDWCPHNRDLGVLTDIVDLALINSDMDIALEYVASLRDGISAAKFEFELDRANSTVARLYVRLGDMNTAKQFMKEIKEPDGSFAPFSIDIPLLKDLVKFCGREEAEKYWSDRNQSNDFSEEVRYTVSEILNSAKVR